MQWKFSEIFRKSMKFSGQIFRLTSLLKTCASSTMSMFHSALNLGTTKLIFVNWTSVLLYLTWIQDWPGMLFLTSGLYSITDKHHKQLWTDLIELKYFAHWFLIFQFEYAYVFSDLALFNFYFVVFMTEPLLSSV